MNTNTLAPVCLFTYNRLKETQQTVEALQRNNLAPQSNLFIFSDGSKTEEAKYKVDAVRQYIQTISGFKSVKILESTTNKGLANSIISGVTQIIEKYGKVIVLEDDLITSPNFLDFMNQALDYYENNSSIHSISGYSLNLPTLKNYPSDYYLGYRASSWGWATWKKKWDTIDWEVKQYHKIKNNPIQQLKFMRGGSDMYHMLKNQMNGKIDSWAIRWCFDQFIKNQMSIFPSKTKVVSVGFGVNATHTKHTSRFENILDNDTQRAFRFEENPQINGKLVKEFRKKFSIFSRLKDKLV